jgi:hypothetical protein
MAECIVCKGDYTPGSPCPRCDADNEPWERWRQDQRGISGWLDFFSRGLYLPVILTALALPVGVAGVQALWLIKQVAWPWSVPVLVVLSFACVLIVVATYEGRNRLRECELLNRVRRGPARFFGAELRALAVPIVVVTAMSAWMAVILSLPTDVGPNNLEHLLSTAQSQGLFSTATWDAVIDILTLGGPLSIAALGYVSLTSAAVYSSSLRLALSYANRMNQRVPLPIFVNTARLVKLVRLEAERHSSSLGPGLTWEGMERTDDGGIELTARYQHDRKVVEDLAGKKSDLPMHTKCKVVADPWGRIRSITPESELQV